MEIAGQTEGTAWIFGAAPEWGATFVAGWMASCALAATSQVQAGREPYSF